MRGKVTVRRTNILAFFAAILGLAVSGLSALGSEAIPKFRTSISYDEARENLIALGWEPATTSKDPSRCALGMEDRCEKYPEVESCAGTGVAPCNLLWRKNGVLISVGTYGEEEMKVGGIECKVDCPRKKPMWVVVTHKMLACQSTTDDPSQRDLLLNTLAHPPTDGNLPDGCELLRVGQKFLLDDEQTESDTKIAVKMWIPNCIKGCVPYMSVVYSPPRSVVGDYLRPTRPPRGFQ